MSTATPHQVEAPSEPDRVLDQLRMDGKLGAPELVTVLTHCAAVVASAEFRLLQAAAILHEDYALSYGERVADFVGHEPLGSVAELRARDRGGLMAHQGGTSG